MASNKGDFKDKQFQANEVADKVVEQYDEKQARVFYKYVMVSSFAFVFFSAVILIECREVNFLHLPSTPMYDFTASKREVEDMTFTTAAFARRPILYSNPRRKPTNVY
jgi:hypothetical protein